MIPAPKPGEVFGGVQAVPEELLAAEELIIRVLDPAQDLVREVVQVLEDREPGHQPGGERRLAGSVAVDRAEALFEEAPVDRAPSFASGCCRSTSWSSRARNRSV